MCDVTNITTCFSLFVLHNSLVTAFLAVIWHRLGFIFTITVKSYRIQNSSLWINFRYHGCFICHVITMQQDPFNLSKQLIPKFLVKTPELKLKVCILITYCPIQNPMWWFTNRKLCPTNSNYIMTDLFTALTNPNEFTQWVQMLLAVFKHESFSPVITADYISHFLSSTSETVQERRSKECSIKKLQDIVGWISLSSSTRINTENDAKLIVAKSRTF